MPDENLFDNEYEAKILALFILCKAVDFPMDKLWGDSAAFTKLKNTLKETTLDKKYQDIYKEAKCHLENVYFNIDLIQFIKDSYCGQFSGKPICVFCNSSLVDNMNRWQGTMDHFANKSNYNAHTFSMSNLIPMCRSCNTTKGAKETIWKAEKNNIINSCFKVVHPYKEDISEFYYFDPQTPQYAIYRVTKQSVDTETNIERKGELIVNFMKAKNTMEMIKINDCNNVINEIKIDLFKKNRKKNERRNTTLSNLMKNEKFYDL